MKRRGLTPNLVPTISLSLATHASDYVRGLTGFRYSEDEDPNQARAQINDWISFFAGSCIQACEEAAGFEAKIHELQETWRQKLGAVRRGSALEALLNEMVGMPIFTIGSASESLERAFSAVSSAVERCIEAGIVKPMGSQRRGRVFEVPDVINEFNVFERGLASPVGDTSIQKPVRPVPDRLR